MGKLLISIEKMGFPNEGTPMISGSSNGLSDLFEVVGR